MHIPDAHWGTRVRQVIFVAVLVCLTHAGQAQAQRVLEPDDLSKQRVTRNKAMASVPAARAAEYAKDHETSGVQARRSLALQRQVPDLLQVLSAEAGEGFAQLSFDNDAGEFAIRGRGGETSEKVAAVMRRLELEDGYRFIATEYDRADLEQARASLLKAVQEVIAAGDVIVDERAGKLQVTVIRNGSLDEVRRRVADAGLPEGVPIDVAEDRRLDPRPTLSCTWPNCDNVVGGVPYGFASGDFACTHGFYVGSSGTPRPLMLTAGHCTIGRDWQPLWLWNPGWVPQQIGNQIPYLYFDSRGDAGLMEITNGRAASPGYFNWSTGGYSGLEAYFTASLPPGYAVCKHTGRWYGFSVQDQCGYTVAHSGTLTYQPGDVTVTGMTAVDSGICSKRGDSGSPVTWANDEVAVGIMSGSSNDNGAGDANVADCSTFSYVEPIHRALSQLGIVLYGGPAA